MPDQPTLTVVISRSPNEDASQHALQNRVAGELADRGALNVLIVPSLHDVRVDGPAMASLAAVEGDLIVLAWLFPRATHWLLDLGGVHGRMGRTQLRSDDQGDGQPEEDAPGSLATLRDAPLSQRTIYCLDFRASDRSEPFVDEISRIAAAGGVPLTQNALRREPVTVDEQTASRWYPVIDAGRCVNCMECIDFCLFGVYGLDPHDLLLVEQPDACRAGCPACSRVCPSGAIIFPRHEAPSIAGGRQDPAGGGKLDLTHLLSGALPADIAGRERSEYLAASGHDSQPSREDAPVQQPSPSQADNDDLDALMDELDDSDI